MCLGNPGNKEIADWLDFNDDIEETNVWIWLSSEKVFGIAATVYGDNDGLAILVPKINTPCEQAGRQDQKFRIQIYWGFPLGLSGQAKSRAYNQAKSSEQRYLYPKTYEQSANVNRIS